jgi:hypothetical protein
VARFSAVSAGQLYTLDLILVQMSARFLIDNSAIMQPEILGQWKSSDTIENRSRVLSVWSAVAQPLQHRVYGIWNQQLYVELISGSNYFIYEWDFKIFFVFLWHILESTILKNSDFLICYWYFLPRNADELNFNFYSLICFNSNLLMDIW